MENPERTPTYLCIELKSYYASKGKLVTVKGQEHVEDTTALTLRALED